MAYKALYRKYRPETFDNVVGQTHIIKTLQNAIYNNKVAHAYIFSGPRGTGKTTTAKLLAKALNCLEEDNRPCNECPASKKEYMLKDKNISIYVAVLNGEIKDNYMAIAFSEKEAKQQVINAYFKEKGHTEKDLEKDDIYITITPFLNGKTISIS